MAKKPKKQAGGTPATVALTAAGVPYTVHSYDHDPAHPSYGEEAAEAMGVSPERVFKTLVADVDGALTVAVVPVAGTLDLKALATAVGGKRAAMADPALAERTTGYVRGGISPLGQRRRLPTVLDASADAHATICVSAGRRGPGGRTLPRRPRHPHRSGPGPHRTCVTPRRAAPSPLSREGMSKRTRKRKWRTKKRRANHGRRPA